MRAGGCSIYQSLTPEAAAIVKQAISLARRRGHAQVTPLHVANTMLSSSTGLLRSACLQSHSHPLQCKALELCFNVALNRLPAASSSSPLLPPQHPPSLSNALIAAFKRAQAHQRRGSIENQQQPLLSVKIELEQLIVSILDDPSVSRVMREAGFSSTQVKSNVEHAISLEPNPSPNHKRNASEKADEDIACLVESLMSSKKRSIVVVGECLASTEGVVKGFMERVDKGEVPEILRNLQFINLPLLSFSGMSRGEVELKVSDLKCLLMKNGCVGKGVVLYLEDIKWVAEFRANSYEARGGFYCPVEHVIMEIGRLVFSGINGGEDGGIRGRGGRFWLMGISTYQTYMRCKIGNPSLEVVWGLHPLTIPVGSLELSLNCDNCDTQSLHKSSISGAWPILEDTAGNQLTCCTNFPKKFEKDAQVSTTSALPSWLLHYKEKNKRDDKDLDCLNSISILQNHTSEVTLHFSSTSPSSSISSYNHHNTAIGSNQRQHPWKQNQVWLSDGISRGLINSSRAFPFTIFDNSSSVNPNLISTANTMDMEHHYKFKEVNAENLKILCNALERKVPWQKNIIPDIASTILQCRAGMKRRNKEDTWLFFQGGDIESKETIARELASLVFGYQTSFFALGLSSSSSTKSDSTDDVRNKRFRSEASHGFLEKLVQAVRENPHRVFLVEDIEQVDFHSQVGIMSAIERGSFWSLEGGEVAIKDAIVILSCEAFDSRSRGCSPPVKQKIEREEGKGEEISEKEKDQYLCLDLNLCAADNETAELWRCGESERLLGAVDRAFFFKTHEDL